MVWVSNYSFLAGTATLSARGSMFQVSVLWRLLEWKAGTSPGSSNTFTSKQVGGWCSGVAAAAFPCPWHQIHSRRLGESQLWSLNTEAALPKQKRTLRGSMHSKTRRTSKSCDGGVGWGECGHGTEPIYCFSPCLPPSPDTQQGLRKSLHAAHTGCASCGQTSLLSPLPECAVRFDFLRWTFNPDHLVAKYFIAANQHASVPKIFLFLCILPNSQQQQIRGFNWGIEIFILPSHPVSPS